MGSNENTICKTSFVNKLKAHFQMISFKIKNIPKFKKFFWRKIPSFFFYSIWFYIYFMIFCLFSPKSKMFVLDARNESEKT